MGILACFVTILFDPYCFGTLGGGFSETIPPKIVLAVAKMILDRSLPSSVFKI